MSQSHQRFHRCPCPNRRKANLTWVLLVGLGSCLGAYPAQLQPETLQAWQEYLALTESRLKSYHQNPGRFLWLDEQPERRNRVGAGEILVAPWEGRPVRHVPHGLIHHWVGAVLIPGVKLEDVLAVIHDYDNYKQHYKASGVVADSRLIERRDSSYFRFQMRWVKRVLWVTAAVEAEYESREYVLDAQRRYGVARSLRIQEIRNVGGPNERLLPPDTGTGYMWRLYSISKYQETPEGVYGELEALVLSREIPAALSWIVTPVVNRLSRNSLLLTLRLTREAVLKRKRQAQFDAPSSVI